MEEKEDAIYYRCVLKGYTFLDAKEQREELLRLGIQYRALGEKEGQEEVTQWMAMAYEQNGKKSDAAKMYEELLAVEGKKAEREELYRKVTELFLADKKKDDAYAYILEESGKSFDPHIVAAFKKIYPSVRKLYNNNPANHEVSAPAPSAAHAATRFFIIRFFVMASPLLKCPASASIP